ncbi:MAG: proton-conducting transporter membrane subunit, partial [Tepidisphaeraceae bacterium]
MEFLNHWLLTILIFLPSVGAILTLLAKGRDAVRWTALITSLVTFLLSLLLFATFNWTKGSGYGYLNPDGTGGVVQMVQAAPWIRAFNIEYRVGIDGLSFPLVLLSTLICLLSCIASWNIDKMIKGYMALFLFLETGILGVFLSLDFFLFYVFFEVSLLPMYFLIGIWGGPRKEYAAIKFFLYTLAGSICLLIVMLGLYFYT